MTIKEAIETAKRIIPYRYNVSPKDVQAAKDTIWNAAKNDEICEKLSLDERQIIWDALFYYQRYCYDMIKTPHFGNEFGFWKKLAEETQALQLKISEEWEDVK